MLTITVIQLFTLDVEKFLAREFPRRLALFWLSAEVLARIVSPFWRTIANSETEVWRLWKRWTRFSRLLWFRHGIRTPLLCGRWEFLASW